MSAVQELTVLGDAEPAVPPPTPSLPDGVSEISREESVEEPSRKGEWPSGSDRDSGDSIFLTQKEPAPETSRPRRRPTFSSRSGFDGNVNASLSSSIQSGQYGAEGVKARQKWRQLPVYSFPFLKGRKKKPRVGMLFVRENKAIHNSATGGFFKCIRELWERNQTASNLQASLPTVDAEGEDIAPLTEEEEKGSSDDEDFWLADRRELLQSCTVLNRVPWYCPPETTSRIRKRRRGARRPPDEVLVISDSSDDETKGGNNGAEEAPAATPPPQQGTLAKRNRLRRNRDDAPDAGEKEREELPKAGTSWDYGAGEEVAATDEHSQTAAIKQEDQTAVGESNRGRTEAEDKASSTSRLKKKKKVREKDEISVDVGERVCQREDQAAAGESEQKKMYADDEALSSSRPKKKKKKKVREKDDISVDVGGVVDQTAAGDSEQGRGDADDKASSSSRPKKKKKKKKKKEKEAEQAEMSHDLGAAVESRAEQVKAGDEASAGSILKKKKKKKKTKAESPDGDQVPEGITETAPHHKRRKGKSHAHLV